MNHRHLLPNEIDLLLDGEGGFGVAPLRAHAEDCSECRARLEEARLVVDALEALPHFSPSVTLSDRVMAQVPVFVPWHVAARDSVGQYLAAWAPRSRPLRTLALAGASSVLAVLTAAIFWVATQADLLAVAGGMAGNRVQGIFAGVLRDVLGALLGDQMLAAIQQSGLAGVGLAGAGFLVAAAGTFAGLRRLATVRQRG